METKVAGGTVRQTKTKKIAEFQDWTWWKLKETKMVRIDKSCDLPYTCNDCPYIYCEKNQTPDSPKEDHRDRPACSGCEFQCEPDIMYCEGCPDLPLALVEVIRKKRHKLLKKLDDPDFRHINPNCDGCEYELTYDLSACMEMKCPFYQEEQEKKTEKIDKACGHLYSCDNCPFVYCTKNTSKTRNKCNCERCKELGL